MIINLLSFRGVDRCAAAVWLALPWAHVPIRVSFRLLFISRILEIESTQYGHFNGNVSQLELWRWPAKQHCRRIFIVPSSVCYLSHFCCWFVDFVRQPTCEKTIAKNAIHILWVECVRDTPTSMTSSASRSLAHALHRNRCHWITLNSFTTVVWLANSEKVGQKNWVMWSELVSWWVGEGSNVRRATNCAVPLRHEPMTHHHR